VVNEQGRMWNWNCYDYWLTGLWCDVLCCVVFCSVVLWCVSIDVYVVFYQPPPAFSIHQWIEHAITTTTTTAIAIAQMTNPCHINQLIILSHPRIPIHHLLEYSIVPIE
jgi:hypothetical protein